MLEGNMEHRDLGQRPLENLLSLRDWYRPYGRLVAKVIAILVTLTFMFPYVAFAFDPVTYPSERIGSAGYAPLKVNGELIKIPIEQGQVTSSYQGKSGLTVVYLQDLHCNYEVQTNIRTILEQLSGSHKLRLIGVEGDSTPIDVSRLATIPDAKIRENVGQYFLRRGRITGPEYQAAVNPAPLRVQGIETQALYDLDKKSLMNFLNEEMQGYCEDLRRSLDNLKRPLYNVELSKLDHARQEYEEANVGLEKYCDYLIGEAQRKLIDLASFPALKVYSLERRLPKNLAVDFEKLIADAEKLDLRLREAEYTRPEQRQLDHYLRLVRIIDGMINISATFGDLEYFRTHRQEFALKGMLNFLENISYEYAMRPELDPEVVRLEDALNRAADFYTVADQRSEAFVRNLVIRMREQNETFSALITGGFHASQVEQILRRDSISYLTVKPRITRADVANPYFSLLRNQRTPIEQLLARNEKIFAPASLFNNPVFRSYLQLIWQIELRRKVMDEGLTEAQRDTQLAALRQGYPFDDQRFPLSWETLATKKGMLVLKYSLQGGKTWYVVIRPNTSATASVAAEFTETLNGSDAQFQFYSAEVFTQNSAEILGEKVEPARAGPLAIAQAVAQLFAQNGRVARWIGQLAVSLGAPREFGGVTSVRQVVRLVDRSVRDRIAARRGNRPSLRERWAEGREALARGIAMADPQALFGVWLLTLVTFVGGVVVLTTGTLAIPLITPLVIGLGLLYAGMCYLTLNNIRVGRTVKVAARVSMLLLPILLIWLTNFHSSATVAAAPSKLLRADMGGFGFAYFALWFGAKQVKDPVEEALRWADLKYGYGGNSDTLRQDLTTVQQMAGENPGLRQFIQDRPDRLAVAGMVYRGGRLSTQVAFSDPQTRLFAFIQDFQTGERLARVINGSWLNRIWRWVPGVRLRLPAGEIPGDAHLARMVRGLRTGQPELSIEPLGNENEYVAERVFDEYFSNQQIAAINYLAKKGRTPLVLSGIGFNPYMGFFPGVELTSAEPGQPAPGLASAGGVITRFYQAHLDLAERLGARRVTVPLDESFQAARVEITAWVSARGLELVEGGVLAAKNSVLSLAAILNQAQFGPILQAWLKEYPESAQFLSQPLQLSDAEQTRLSGLIERFAQDPKQAAINEVAVLLGPKHSGRQVGEFIRVMSHFALLTAVQRSRQSLGTFDGQLFDTEGMPQFVLLSAGSMARQGEPSLASDVDFSFVGNQTVQKPALEALKQAVNNQLTGMGMKAEPTALIYTQAELLHWRDHMNFIARTGFSTARVLLGDPTVGQLIFNTRSEIRNDIRFLYDYSRTMVLLLGRVEPEETITSNIAEIRTFLNGASLLLGVPLTSADQIVAALQQQGLMDATQAQELLRAYEFFIAARNRVALGQTVAPTEIRPFAEGSRNAIHAVDLKLLTHLQMRVADGLTKYIQQSQRAVPPTELLAKTTDRSRLLFLWQAASALPTIGSFLNGMNTTIQNQLGDLDTLFQWVSLQNGLPAAARTQTRLGLVKLQDIRWLGSGTIKLVQTFAGTGWTVESISRLPGRVLPGAQDDDPEKWEIARFELVNAQGERKVVLLKQQGDSSRNADRQLLGNELQKQCGITSVRCERFEKSSIILMEDPGIYLANLPDLVHALERAAGADAQRQGLVAAFKQRLSFQAGILSASQVIQANATPFDIFFMDRALQDLVTQGNVDKAFEYLDQELLQKDRVHLTRSDFSALAPHRPETWPLLDATEGWLDETFYKRGTQAFQRVGTERKGEIKAALNKYSAAATVNVSADSISIFTRLQSCAMTAEGALVDRKATRELAARQAARAAGQAQTRMIEEIDRQIPQQLQGMLKPRLMRVLEAVLIGRFESLKDLGVMLPVGVQFGANASLPTRAEFDRLMEAAVLADENTLRAQILSGLEAKIRPAVPAQGGFNGQATIEALRGLLEVFFSAEPGQIVVFTGSPVITDAVLAARETLKVIFAKVRPNAIWNFFKVFNMILDVEYSPEQSLGLLEAAAQRPAFQGTTPDHQTARTRFRESLAALRAGQGIEVKLEGVTQPVKIQRVIVRKLKSGLEGINPWKKEFDKAGGFFAIEGETGVVYTVNEDVAGVAFHEFLEYGCDLPHDTVARLEGRTATPAVVKLKGLAPNTLQAINQALGGEYSVIGQTRINESVDRIDLRNTAGDEQTVYVKKNASAETELGNDLQELCGVTKYKVAPIPGDAKRTREGTLDVIMGDAGTILLNMTAVFAELQRAAAGNGGRQEILRQFGLRLSRQAGRLAASHLVMGHLDGNGGNIFFMDRELARLVRAGQVDAAFIHLSQMVQNQQVRLTSADFGRIMKPNADADRVGEATFTSLDGVLGELLDQTAFRTGYQEGMMRARENASQISIMVARAPVAALPTEFQRPTIMAALDQRIARVEAAVVARDLKQLTASKTEWGPKTYDLAGAEEVDLDQLMRELRQQFGEPPVEPNNPPESGFFGVRTYRSLVDLMTRVLDGSASLKLLVNNSLYGAPAVVTSGALLAAVVVETLFRALTATQLQAIFRNLGFKVAKLKVREGEQLLQNALRRFSEADMDETLADKITPKAKQAVRALLDHAPFTFNKNGHSFTVRGFRVVQLNDPGNTLKDQHLRETGAYLQVVNGLAYVYVMPGVDPELAVFHELAENVGEMEHAQVMELQTAYLERAALQWVQKMKFLQAQSQPSLQESVFWLGRKIREGQLPGMSPLWGDLINNDLRRMGLAALAIRRAMVRKTFDEATFSLESLVENLEVNELDYFTVPAEASEDLTQIPAPGDRGENALPILQAGLPKLVQTAEQSVPGVAPAFAQAKVTQFDQGLQAGQMLTLSDFRGAVRQVRVIRIAQGAQATRADLTGADNRGVFFKVAGDVGYVYILPGVDPERAVGQAFFEQLGRVPRDQVLRVMDTAYPVVVASAQPAQVEAKPAEAHALSLGNVLLNGLLWTLAFAFVIGAWWIPLVYFAPKLGVVLSLLSQRQWARPFEPVGMYDRTLKRVVDPVTRAEIMIAPWILVAHENYSHRRADQMLTRRGLNPERFAKGSWMRAGASVLNEGLAHLYDVISPVWAAAEVERPGANNKLALLSGIFAFSGLFTVFAILAGFTAALPLLAGSFIIAGLGVTMFSMTATRVQAPMSTARPGVPAEAGSLVALIQREQALGIEPQPGSLAEYWVRFQASRLGRAFHQLTGLATSLKLLLVTNVARTETGKYVVTGLLTGIWAGVALLIGGSGNMEAAVQLVLVGLAATLPVAYLELRLLSMPDLSPQAVRVLINSPATRRSLNGLTTWESASMNDLIKALLMEIEGIQASGVAQQAEQKAIMIERILDLLATLPIPQRAVEVNNRPMNLPAVIFEVPVLQRHLKMPVLENGQPIRMRGPRLRQTIGSSA